MSGHSKWAQIKHKKAATDTRRGKLFTKLLKEIAVAARLGGGDPGGNPRLRSAIAEAKASNVPNDNIDRAIRKGTGELEGATYEEAVYEGYGPGGVAVLVETLTDNRNRTVSEVRHLFAKHGGSLGENGCVSWMFTKRGYFAIDQDALDEEAFMELALELGAADIAIGDGAYEIFTSMEDYPAVREALEARGIPLSAKELAMIPQSYLELDDEKKVGQVMRLMDALEDHEDVQHVWANFDVDESVIDAPPG